MSILITKRKTLVTVDIFYYIPSTRLLNEFLWQTDDYVPGYPRVEEFLDFWQKNIHAVIKEIYLAEGNTGWKRVDFDLNPGAY